MADQIQSVVWPGIPRVDSFSYSCVHGISPGEARIVTYPVGDDVTPAQFGTLLLSDGFNVVPLRNAKFKSIEASHTTGEGTVYVVTILDRRWRWRNQFGGLGRVDGRYNQLDTRGKLKPWSIRSPEELARLCLDAMGELNYVVDMPPGLTRAAGANVDRFLRLGENFPYTGTNPDTNWDHASPADVLAELCDRFGCRVVYQPCSDRVLIVPLGKGMTALPDWPSEMIARNVADPQPPVSENVYGVPIRVQTRVPLEPVGEEFDGSYLPIDMLSYAPKIADGSKQKLTVTYSGPEPPAYGVEAWLRMDGQDVYLGDSDSDPAATMADRLGRMAAAGTASGAAAKLTFAVDGPTLVVEAKEIGTRFDVEATATDLYGDGDEEVAGTWSVELVTPSKEPGRGWSRSYPPNFRNVLPTDELPYSKALELARKSVFKCFRVMLASPNTRKPPLTLPLFGEIKRLTQLVVQPTKVEQVVPQPRIAGGVNRGDRVPGAPLDAGVLPEFYNGRSRDQVATVTGRVSKLRIGGQSIIWAPDQSADPYNTKATDRVFVDFSVTTADTGDQLVIFSDHVYEDDRAGSQAYVKSPELTLETAFLVTDPETDQLYRYENSLPIPGGVSPPAWHYHEDLQVNAIALFDSDPIIGQSDAGIHRPVGFKYGTGDMEDATPRSVAYLTGHARKYQLTAGETRQCPALVPVDPDGTIQQVTWTFGGGATTKVGLNTEFGIQVNPISVRRRAELLPPDKAAAAANARERAIVDKIFPQAGSQVR